jgi:predicted dehydrogenase
MARVGFIGAGMVAAWHIGCMTKLVPEADIVGLTDIDQHRADRLAQQFDIKTFPRNEDLFNADVDAVFVCTYPKAHRACVLAALEAGKHVFCEKPLAPTYAEGLEIARAAERSGKKFMLGYVFHFSESARRIKSLIDESTLGQLALVWSHRLAPFVPSRGSWYADPVGGGILDFCTHDLELLSWWAGRPLSVTATALAAQPGLGCMDTTAVTMRFETPIGTVMSSWAAQFVSMNMGATGTKGTAMLVQDGAGFALSSVTKLEGHEETRGPREELETVMAAEQRYFINNLERDETISPGTSEGLLALEVHEAVETSWKTGQPVSLGRGREDR